MSWKNIYQDNYAYFFTSSIVEHLPVLRYSKNRQVLLQLLSFYRKKYQVRLHGYVIMPTHIHLLIMSERGENIRRFMQNLLKNASKRIIANTESFLEPPGYSARAKQLLDVFARHANPPARYAVWKEKARGIPIYTDDILKEKLDYIHNNPVKAGLVAIPEDYRWSSFRNYYLDDHSVLEIDYVEALILRRG